MPGSSPNTSSPTTSTTLSQPHLGWSLWLAPPASTPVDTALTTLIHTTIPALFPAAAPLPSFSPHVTLTSNLDPSRIPDPAAYLRALAPPQSLARASRVRFRALVAGPARFKKLFIRCERDDALVALAVWCRREAVLEGDGEAAERWAAEEYDPHCSLMYSEAAVSEEERRAAEGRIGGVGLEERTEGVSEEGAPTGWDGGRIQLVATNDVEVEGWRVVAEIVL